MKRAVFVLLAVGGMLASSAVNALTWKYNIEEDVFTDEKATVASVKGDGGSYISVGCSKGELGIVMKFNRIEHIPLDPVVEVKWRADKKEVNTIEAWKVDNAYAIIDLEGAVHMAKKLFEAKIFAISVNASGNTTTRVYNNLENGKSTIGKVFFSCGIKY